MKKILSLALAFVMVVAMAAPAYAANFSFAIYCAAGSKTQTSSAVTKSGTGSAKVTIKSHNMSGNQQMNFYVVSNGGSTISTTQHWKANKSKTFYLGYLEEAPDGEKCKLRAKIFANPSGSLDASGSWNP